MMGWHCGHEVLVGGLEFEKKKNKKKKSETTKMIRKVDRESE